jgi:hypothetical protein
MVVSDWVSGRVSVPGVVVVHANKGRTMDEASREVKRIRSRCFFIVKIPFKEIVWLCLDMECVFCEGISADSFHGNTRKAYILISQSFSVVIIEDHTAAGSLQDESASNESSVLRTGAADQRTGLTLMVVGASNLGNVDLVHMPAQHELRLDILAQKSRPLGEGLLLNIEGRIQGLGEGIVDDDQTVPDSLGLVFLSGVADDLADICGLTAAEILATDGVSVLNVVIGLVLTAVQNQPPQGAETEGKVGDTASRGCVIRNIFGVDTAGVVVASGEDNGALTVGDLGGNLMDRGQEGDLAAVVGNVTVKHEQIRFIPEITGCRHGAIHAVVGVGDMIDLDGAFCGDRTEGGFVVFNFPRLGAVRLSLDHTAEADRVGTRAIQFLHGHDHAVGGNIGSQDTVGIVIIALISHLYPHQSFAGNGNHDLIVVSDGINYGSGQESGRNLFHDKISFI